MINKNLIKITKWIYLIIIIFVLIIDISSKNWITKHLQIYEIKKIFSILNFFHIHNYGAAFSLLSDQKGWQRWFLSTISVITILVIIKIMIKLNKNEKKKITAYSLIIAGALGNLRDRILSGFVVDFIDIHINDWHFATFNIADCSIFIGIIMLIKINYSISK